MNFYNQTDSFLVKKTKETKRTERLTSFVELGIASLDFPFGSPVLNYKEMKTLFCFKQSLVSSAFDYKGERDIPNYKTDTFVKLIASCVLFNIPIIKKASKKSRDDLINVLLPFKKTVLKKINYLTDSMLDSYIEKYSVKGTEEKTVLSLKNKKFEDKFNLFLNCNKNLKSEDKQLLTNYYDAARKFSVILKELNTSNL